MKQQLNADDAFRANKIYSYMYEHHRKISKEELCTVIGWKYNQSSDRRVRVLLSAIAKRRPIISPSDGAGYMVARYVSDLPEVEHQIAELNSRIAELTARLTPLQEVQQQIKKKQEA